MAVTLVQTINLFITFLSYLIFARALLSWFPNLRGNRFAILVFQLTEPIIGPVRSLLNKTPLKNTVVDFSPLVAYSLLLFLQNILIYLIATYMR